MKKYVCLVFVLCVGRLFGQSIDPVSLIISKAIKAIDLKVQRLQNETLVAQVAQQEAEKEMSRSKLAEITGWQDQLSSLYAGYFSELKQVKSVVSGSSVVQRILSSHKQIVIEYGRLGKDASVKGQYDGLLNASMDVLQTLQLVLGSQLSMKDAERFKVLWTLQDAMDHCLDGLKALNKRQAEMIANRTRMNADIEFVKRLHGIK